ncbi:MAG: Rieske (2Fe-2S) protein [Flammeovirgaceae bacterium]
MKNKRRIFLKNAGSTALFASLGSSFFISCDDTEEVIKPDDNNENSTSENGFTLDGNTYTIELNHPSFSVLKSAGGWYLFNEGGMLLVNVGQDVIRAFSNSCPHAGCRSSWKYSNENFTCTCHTSIFTNEGTLVSGPANSDLDSFSTSRDDDTLTVTT